MALNFNTITNSFKKTVQNNLGLTSLLSSSQPMASLRESMLKYKSFVTSRLPMCEDAVNVFTNIASVAPAASFDLSYSGLIPMTDEIGQQLLNMLLEASGDQFGSLPISRTTSWCFTLPSGHTIGLSTVLTTAGYIAITLGLFPSDENQVTSENYVFLGSLPLDPDDVTHHTVKSSDDLPECALNADMWKSILPNFSIYDLFGSLVDMSNCNSCITKCIDILSNSGINMLACLQNLQNTVRENFTDKVSYAWNSAKSFVNQVTQGYLDGGMKGAIMAILRWAGAGRSLSATSSHGMEFTENADLVPSSYIFGILGAIGAAVTTVLSLVVSFFSKIVGVALGLASTVLWSLLGSIKYDEGSTRAGIATDDTVDAPWLQPSLMKIEIPYNANILNSELSYLLENGVGLVRLQVPFGYLLCGKYVDDLDMQYLRVEFHPDYLDRRSGLRLIGDKFEVGSEYVSNLFYYTMNFKAQYANTTIHQILEMLMAADTNAIDPTFVQDIDQTSGVYRLDASSDNALRDIVASNYGGFILYCCLSACRDESDTVLNALDIDSILAGKYIGDANAAEHDNGHLWLPGTFNHSGNSLSCWDFFVVNAILGPRDGLGGVWSLSYNTWSWTDIIAKLDVYEGVGDEHLVPNVGIDRGNMFGENIFFESWACKDYSQLALSDDSLAIRVGEYIPLTTSSCYAVYLPEYDAKSFWRNVAIAIAVTAVVAAVAVAATITVKKQLRKLQAKSAMEVERAWSDYTDNTEPHTDEERAAFQKNYFKAVKKANFIAGITGGTKYDYNGFWNGDPTAEASTEDAEVASNTSVISAMTDEFLRRDGKLSAGQVGYGEYSMAQLYHDITGKNWASEADGEND